MDAASDVTASTQHSPFFSLARLALILVPALSFIGYYAPYLIGLAYREHFLNLYDVPPGLFPSETRQVFVYAYEAILEIFGHWIIFVSQTYFVPVIFGCVLFLSLEFALLNWLSKSTKLEDALNRRVSAKWAKLLLLLVALSTALTGVAVSLPIALYVFIAAPAKIGGFSAELTFEREQTLLGGGCGVENASHIYCKAIVDNDKIIAVGFEIVTSDNRIALYQPKQTKILKLGDAVIEVMRPEDFRRYEALLSKP